ncbi:MAG: ergothioneine biosynthesis protein EgtB [Deltaproteobacteria bacterium]|nr:ergothioneine biosynthesis protein EgtB [Deltaproteobacteria bacterium]
MATGLLTQDPSPRKNDPVESLRTRYRRIRAFTEKLCAPLETEDYVAQSMPDASPTKWHIAHTSWFFETFVLMPGLASYRAFDSAFRFLFNSYYNAVGPQFSRPRRGVITRPTVKEVYRYRAHVDDAMDKFFDDADREPENDLLGVVEIGLHHEQQHQELILTDIKHVLACNPTHPVYRAAPIDNASPVSATAFVGQEGGLVDIGHAGGGFAYDNEGPRHAVHLRPYRIANRLVTSGEYLEFMKAGGYEKPELWLSDGWHAIQAHGWRAPLYWEIVDGEWHMMTLGGFRPVVGAEPVCHVSFYEADAFAAWAGARLPTEAEWEHAARDAAVEGNFVEGERFHPASAPPAKGVAQLFGDVWEWTRSAYEPYPRYKAAEGAIGEYNGKFMCNQMVLRGGSCATSSTHIRATYRNFFPPSARWQFMGIRLAQDE